VLPMHGSSALHHGRFLVEAPTDRGSGSDSLSAHGPEGGPWSVDFTIGDGGVEGDGTLGSAFASWIGSAGIFRFAMESMVGCQICKIASTGAPL
jgi:hypothetical protein